MVKNKVAPPFKKTEFDIIYGQGISKNGCVLDEAINRGIASKSGAWFNYGEDRLGQGRDNAITFLNDNPEIAEEIKRLVLEQVGIIPGAPVVTIPDA